MIHELFTLAGRTALVTGGNGGLGYAMARALSGAGANVVVTGRDVAKNRAARARFPCCRLDVRKEREVERVMGYVVRTFGQLDILVNNAGVFRGGASVDLTGEGWREVLDTNLTGAFLCAKHAARAMIDSRGATAGKIINVGSMYSQFGHAVSASYTASKTGILGLTRALAVELGPQRICVNAILPGWFPTDMSPGIQRSRLGRALEERTPAGRLGSVDDLSGVVVFLASSASDFVNGVAIPVDGGYSVSDRTRSDISRRSNHPRARRSLS
jgi:2-dehydro-3-deoxy-D-gluconate 5-dehydrogenase